MKKINYRQCTFEKKEPLYKMIQTAWVPEYLAVEGESVRFKSNGDWSDGWFVVHVGAIKSQNEMTQTQTL